MILKFTSLLYVMGSYPIFHSFITVQLYPYLVVNDAWLTESRREERVLQLLRMVNLFLEKRKVNFCFAFFLRKGFIKT